MIASELQLLCSSAYCHSYYQSELVKYTCTFLLHFQVQVKGSGQVTIPCVELSDCGVLELNNDVAVMTDFQYGGRTMCMIKYLT